MVITGVELLTADEMPRDMAPDMDRTHNGRGPGPLSRRVPYLSRGLFCVDLAPLQVSAPKYRFISLVRMSMLTKDAKIFPHPCYQQILAKPAQAVAGGGDEVSKTCSLE